MTLSRRQAGTREDKRGTRGGSGADNRRPRQTSVIHRSRWGKRVAVIFRRISFGYHLMRSLKLNCCNNDKLRSMRNPIASGDIKPGINGVKSRQGNRKIVVHSLQQCTSYITRPLPFRSEKCLLNVLANIVDKV